MVYTIAMDWGKRVYWSHCGGSAIEHIFNCVNTDWRSEVVLTIPKRMRPAAPEGISKVIGQTNKKYFDSKKERYLCYDKVRALVGMKITH